MHGFRMCFSDKFVSLFMVHIYQRGYRVTQQKVTLHLTRLVTGSQIEAALTFFFLFFSLLLLPSTDVCHCCIIAGFCTQVFLPRIFNINTNRHINNKRIIMYTFFFISQSLYVHVYKQLCTIENRLPSDSIFNLTKGQTVCYLSCRGVNYRKTLFWPLQDRRPS